MIIKEWSAKRLKLLIIDTETNAKTPDEGSVIEIGAILYDVDYKTPLIQLSLLFPASDNAAEHINGISPSVLQGLQWNDRALSAGLNLFNILVAQATYMVAHNAEFDRQWFNGDVLPEIDLPWLCTMEDFKFSKGKQGDSLVSLVLAHGLGVSHAHRALTDCMMISRLFDITPNLKDAVEYAARPKQLYWANVPFNKKDLAKEAGFRWEPSVKQWQKRLTQEEAASLCFPVELVSDVKEFVF